MYEYSLAVEMLAHRENERLCCLIFWEELLLDFPTQLIKRLKSNQMPVARRAKVGRLAAAHLIPKYVAF